MEGSPIMLITIVIVITAVLVISKFLSNKKLQLLQTAKAVLEIEVTLLRNNVNEMKEDLKKESEKAAGLTADLSERTAQRDNAIEQTKTVNEEMKSLKTENEIKGKEIQRLASENISLETELKFSNEKLEKQKEEIEEIGKSFEKEFLNLAQKVLDEKSKSFGQQQENHLKILLEPFKNDIANFKKEFSDKHSLEAAERNSLKGAILQMVDNNKVLSEQANNLSKALTFQAKHQGSWGEEILESILEHCGLQKSIHYFKQYSSTNEDGARIRPDFIVNCPEGRCVIIDSKVSLNHYTNYCATNNPGEQEGYAKGMLASIRSHIDNLSSKNYTDIANTLDSVIMFMPVESAYILAIQMDNDLWRYAYSKRVLLISSSNLIATIKLISDLWQRDAINKNAKQIAEKAGRLYDKLVGFVENMKKVGDSIGKANEIWTTAYGQLYIGHGNMINQAQAIKELGAKTGQRKFGEDLISEAELQHLPLNGN